MRHRGIGTVISLRQTRHDKCDRPSVSARIYLSLFDNIHFPLQRKILSDMKGRFDLKKYRRLEIRRSHLRKTSALWDFSIARGNPWKKNRTRETCHFFFFRTRKIDLRLLATSFYSLLAISKKNLQVFGYLTRWLPW